MNRTIINRLSAIVLAVFIFFVMSFGRVFSYLHLGNIYITEIIMGLMFFIVLFNRRKIKEIPHIFLFVLLAYFIMGCSYFLTGISKDSSVSRDIVFFGYIIFFPAAFILFSQKTRMKMFLSAVLFSNVIGLVMVRVCIYREFPWPLLHEFFGKIKPFNYCIYYGISLSFLVAAFFLVKKIKFKALIAIFCSLNVYLLIIWGVRAAWLACMALSVFFIFTLGLKRIKNFARYFIPFFILISVVSLSFDYKAVYQEVGKGKLASVFTFFENSTAWFNKFIIGVEEHDKTGINNDFPGEITFVPSDANLQPKAAEGAPTPVSVSAPSVLIHPEKKSLDSPEHGVQADTAKAIPSVSMVAGHAIEKDSFYYEVYQELNRHDSESEYMYDFSSISWRLDLWMKMINLIKKHPFLGSGFGVYPITSQYGVTPPHNHLISIFYKMGLSGFILFFAINLLAFYYGFSHLRKCKSDFIRSMLLGCLGSMIFWHVIAFFFDVIDSPPTSIFLWIIMGLLFACIRIDEEDKLV